MKAYLVKTELYFEEIWRNYFPKDGEIIYLRSTIGIFYFINMVCYLQKKIKTKHLDIIMVAVAANPKWSLQKYLSSVYHLNKWLFDCKQKLQTHIFEVRNSKSVATFNILKIVLGIPAH